MPFRYTDEMLGFLEIGFKSMPVAELTNAFNQKYDTNKKKTAIHGLLTRKGFTCGRSGHFKKGQKSWNHGKKGYMGPNRTSFKKGNLPHNHKPLWSERISKDGYVEISVPERNPHTGFKTRYKHKHVWLWEQQHGPAPKGYAVVFKDGNNRNFEDDNLRLISRAELLYLNRNGYSKLPVEFKPTMRKVAKVAVKAAELGRS